jgi:SAM-dependent methyltransferase
MQDPIVDAPTHYEQLLARLYRWMCGPLPVAQAAARAQLAELGIGPALEGERALDLGAGPGFHAIALAELGYRVWALDSSRALLDELAALAPGVRTVRGRIEDARSYVHGTYDVILCLGDTLPHLASRADVDAALADAVELLAPGGWLCVSFRDHAAAAPGEVRHVVVRGDAERILTCRIEHRDDVVICTDVLHERIDRVWRVRASAYPKLRLDPRAIVDRLRARLTDVEARTAGGWVTITGAAPT